MSNGRAVLYDDILKTGGMVSKSTDGAFSFVVGTPFWLILNYDIDDSLRDCAWWPIEPLKDEVGHDD